MCRGCEYLKSTVNDMPEELTISEVVCLVGRILDAYLSDVSLENKVEICKAIAWDFLQVQASLELLN